MVGSWFEPNKSLERLKGVRGSPLVYPWRLWCGGDQVSSNPWNNSLSHLYPINTQNYFYFSFKKFENYNSQNENIKLYNNSTYSCNHVRSSLIWCSFSCKCTKNPIKTSKGNNFVNSPKLSFSVALFQIPLVKMLPLPKSFIENNPYLLEIGMGFNPSKWSMGNLYHILCLVHKKCYFCKTSVFDSDFKKYM